MRSKIYNPKIYEPNYIRDISGVYQIRNLKNNKIYVGSSHNLLKRKYDHFYTLRHNIHGNRYLQNSFNIHGEENFVFEVIEFCEEKDLLNVEQYWLDKLNTLNKDKGYNIKPQADGSRMAEETKIKLSEDRKGSKNPMYKKFGSKHHNYTKIVCMEELTVYNGFHTIERIKNLSGTHICACCRHKDGRKKVGELHWFYYTEFIEKYPELVNQLKYCDID